MDLLKLQESINRAHNENLLNKNPELTKAIETALRETIEKEVAARYDAILAQANAYITQLHGQIANIEAERDNWRKQALEEDARANAVTVKPQAKRRGRKPKGD